MRRALILVLVFLAACQDGTGPEGPGPVATIELTPQEAVFTTAGATTQFSARAADADGVRVEDAVVIWRSSNPAAVRVDDNGVATAVANGTATITAQVAAVTGAAPATVCTQPLQVSISAGQVYSAPAGCPVLLPSGSVGDRYRVAIVRLTAVADATQVTATLQLTPRGIATAPPATGFFSAVEAPPVALQLGADQIAHLERAAATARATAAVHERIRASEELLLRTVGPQPLDLPLGRALVRTGLDGARAASAPKRPFLARKPTETSCSASPKSVIGLLVAEDADVAIYQDSTQAQSFSRITQAQAQRVLDFYAAHGKPVIQSAFGTPPDRDGNGQIVVLVTPEVGGEGGGATAAFVWGGDLLPKSACQASNEMELVYYNAFMFQKMDQGDYQAPETFVHEVKHIVSFSQRLTGNVFAIPPGWMEEGAAEIAGEKASRRAWAATGGPAENAMVTAQSFPSNRYTLENYGVVLRLFNSMKYLAAPTNAVVFAVDPSYTVYGSGWHFHRFLGDAYGNAGSAPNTDAEFFLRQTSAGTPGGLNGLPVLTGKSFEGLMVEYAAAVMLTGTGAPAPPRAFTTYNFTSATSIVGSGAPAGRYPYPETGTPNNPSVPFATGSWSGNIGNGGLRIHDFTSSGTASAEITATVEQPARVVVVRLR